MAILSYFINEIYKLKINFTLKQLQIQHRKLNKSVISENDLCNVASSVTNLRIYVASTEKEKQLLRGEIQRQQKISG